jgi:hypothetical protein
MQRETLRRFIIYSGNPWLLTAPQSDRCVEAGQDGILTYYSNQTHPLHHVNHGSDLSISPDKAHPPQQPLSPLATPSAAKSHFAYAGNDATSG